MRFGDAPPMTRRLAAFLVAEGHEGGTALDLSRNMVRKWWATGTDHTGAILSPELLEACRAEVVVAETSERQGLSEAAALGLARARSGGRTMRNRHRRELSDQLAHRASIAEGLLLSARKPTAMTMDAARTLLGEAEEHRKIKCPKCGHVQSATDKTCSNCGHDLTDAIKAKFAQEGYSKDELATALREEIRVAGLLREALGYGKHPIRGEKGRFHGMHGRERAAKKGALVRGEGAARCPECGAAIPSKDSSCPACGWMPDVPEAGRTDVLAKLAEATTAALADPAADAAPEAQPDAAARPKQKQKPKPKDAGAAAPEAAPAKPDAGAAGTAPAAADGQAAAQGGSSAAGGGKPAPKGGGRWLQKGVGSPKDGPNTLVGLAQQRLAAIDPAYATDPDGMFGDETEAKVKQFQRDVGLPETGQLDPPTVQAMRNPPTNADGSLRRVGAEASAADQSPGEEPGGSGREADSASSPARGGGLPDPSDPDAIKAWQEQHGLPTSGVVDRATQAAMRAVSRAGAATGADAGMIRRGDGMDGQPDPKVRALQQQLAAAGHDPGGADGRFGEQTDAALRKFQGRYGLRVDGVAAKQTQGILSQVAANGGKPMQQALADALRVELTDEDIEEATYYGVGTTATFGVAKTFGGINPLLLADNLRRAINPDDSEGAATTLNFDPNMTEAAKAELRVREAREAREEAERAGDTVAWNRARARELRAMEAADSMAKASSHEPVGKPGGPGLWKHKGLQLPAYIQHIANDLREKRGMDESRAIATAIAAVKRWAAGGGKVDAGTRAAAQKAVAEWEALKASH